MSQQSLFRFKFVPLFVLLVLTFFSTGLFSNQGYCATVELAWDKPSDTSNIDGYYIYTAPEGSSFPDEATQVIEDPTQTTCSVSGLTEGAIYGFVATSFDADGNESSYSNEAYYTVHTSTQDSDGDGLTDADEDYYGLDPKNPDTTGNGLSDADEVELWGDAWDGDIDEDGTINLLDLDADGDGVSDSTELVQETDPADDSDNESGLPTMVFGEMPVDSDWTTVELNQSFQNPVVVAGPLSSNDTQPAVVRIRNISGNSFDIRAQKYEYLEQAHTQEYLSFLVMEMGNYYLPDGTQNEASYFEANANYSSFDDVSFTSQFATQPVVMTSITTCNVAEEQSPDREIKHATEDVVYRALWSSNASSQQIFVNQ
ncbi:MAG: fibronectin type III domain-containing protein [Desulfovermiculus sp.]